MALSMTGIDMSAPKNLDLVKIDRAPETSQRLCKAGHLTNTEKLLRLQYGDYINY